MTDYKTLKGKRIKTFATDLDNVQAEGQIFFSSSENPDKLKTVVASAAWSSTSPLLEGRTVAQGSAGTATAGLVCFGNPAAAPYTSDSTEEYNGSGWAVGGDTTHGASNATAAGTQTAAIAMAMSDSPTTLTIKYDGTSWTDSGHAFPGTGGGGVGSGTQTATLYSGQGSGTASYEYDGSSWTSGGTMNTSRVGEGTGWGPQTSALMCTGRGSPSDLTSATEEYNGTSWTSTNNVNAARRRISGSKNSPSQDSGIIFGGSTTSNPNAGATVNTEQYDGSSWTEITNLSTGRNHAGGAGNSTGAWVAGSNPNSAATEEFNVTAATITAGAWASGGDTVIGGYGAAGCGTQTAGLIFGRVGEPVSGSPVSGATEEYNGSSWSEQNDLNTARRYTAGFGVQTSAVCAGGGSSTAKVDNSEEYNGSSWSEGNDLNTVRQGAAGAGTLTAGLVFGGNVNPPTPNVAVTETYDGTSYTEVNDLNTARRFVGGCGTQTAALAFGGFGVSTPAKLQTESWDGTNWTTVSNLNIQTAAGGSAGTQAEALFFGGNPGNTTTSEQWDGSAWATAPNLATGRGYLAGAGTASSAFGASGYVPGAPAPTRIHTEEFTGETTSLNLKTITDS